MAHDSLSLTANRMKQSRKCEATFAYYPMNADELQLEVGDIIDIIKEVESHLFLAAKQPRRGSQMLS